MDRRSIICCIFGIKGGGLVGKYCGGNQTFLQSIKEKLAGNHNRDIASVGGINTLMEPTSPYNALFDGKKAL